MVLGPDGAFAGMAAGTGLQGRLAADIEAAVAAYVAEVKAGTFPAAEHSF